MIDASNTNIDIQSWVREAPRNWKIKPLKYILTRLSISGCEDEKLLSVYRDYGVLIRENRDDNHNRVSADLSNYQLVDIGDLVINKMKAWQGSLGVSEHRGIVSPAYHIYKIISKSIHPRFLHHALRSEPYFREYAKQSKGIRTNQWDLGTYEFGCIEFLHPPLETQRQIATYLDKKTEAIDTLIAKKQKMIELLEEKRSALINHVVTKGLNPDAPMKDSGVPWIGEVPAHWYILQFRRLILDICDGPFGSSLKSEHYTEEGTRLIRLQNIKSGYFNNQSKAFISNNYAKLLKRHKALPGDLLIASLGDTNNPMGRACVLPIEVEEAIVKADCFRARLDQKQGNHLYYSHYLSSLAGAVGFEQHSRGATRSRINLSIVRDIEVPKPSLAEQDSIQSRIKSFESKNNNLRNQIEDQVTKLQEYRQALITAAVTGKIDVTRDPTSDDPEEAASGQGTLF